MRLPCPSGPDIAVGGLAFGVERGLISGAEPQSHFRTRSLPSALARGQRRAGCRESWDRPAPGKGRSFVTVSPAGLGPQESARSNWLPAPWPNAASSLPFVTMGGGGACRKRKRPRLFYEWGSAAPIGFQRLPEQDTPVPSSL